jgi:hypothetical protein
MLLPPGVSIFIVFVLSLKLICILLLVVKAFFIISIFSHYRGRILAAMNHSDNDNIAGILIYEANNHLITYFRTETCTSFITASRLASLVQIPSPLLSMTGILTFILSCPSGSPSSFTTTLSAIPYAPYQPC